MTEPFHEKTRELGARAARHTVQENGEELREIGSLIDAGRVMPRLRNPLFCGLLTQLCRSY